VDQLVLDELPYDARHLVPVEFHDGILNLDSAHEKASSKPLERRDAADKVNCRA
jgi:hypothetical protein